MKTLNNAIGIKLLSIIFIIMLTQSCSKDTKCSFADTNIYYNVADSNKAKIPYTGSDTLVFVSDQGDTATLVGQGKKTYYNTVTNNTNTVDCPKIENRNYENVEVDFVGSNPIFNQLSFKTYMDGLVGVPSLTSVSCYFNFSNIANSSWEYINSKKSADDSINYQNKQIEGCYINFNKTILLNKELGILKVIVNQSKTWILIYKS